MAGKKSWLKLGSWTFGANFDKNNAWKYTPQTYSFIQHIVRVEMKGQMKPVQHMQHVHPGMTMQQLPNHSNATQVSPLNDPETLLHNWSL